MKNIYFKDVPVVQSRQEIVVDGQVVGRIELCELGSGPTFHVLLQLRTHSELFQGFGDTPDDAIANAFVRGSQQIETATAELAVLKHMLADK